MVNSRNYEDGRWKSLAEDEDIIFGNMEIRLVDDIIISAEADINHKIFPTTLRTKLNL